MDNKHNFSPKDEVFIKIALGVSIALSEIIIIFITSIDHILQNTLIFFYVFKFVFNCFVFSKKTFSYKIFVGFLAFVIYQIAQNNQRNNYN